MKDALGDRMKSFEEVETSSKFNKDSLVYARLDGRGFSKFTKNMKRPFDEEMAKIMIEVTKKLVKETNALIGYTQSDEISLAWKPVGDIPDLIFSGKKMKSTSILAGMASSSFMYELLQTSYSDKMKYIPHFDCRMFNVPENEIANMFLWRANDANRNAVSMAAHSRFSHKSLQSVGKDDMKERLLKDGIDFDLYPNHFKFGTFVKKVTKLKKVPEHLKMYTSEEYVKRNVIEEMDIGVHFMNIDDRSSFILS